MARCLAFGKGLVGRHAVSIFEQAFGVIVGNEGGYSADPADPGNWTGGRVGVGVCKGTRYGISASAFPTLHIADLTLEQARAIYQTRYWAPVCADALPPGLALLVFDSAVNNGVGRAARLLQASVGAVQDGLIGPVTLGAVRAAVAGEGLEAVCAEFQARRLQFMVALPGWRSFGLGWARRLCRLPFQAQALVTTSS